jgi:hypothetical protein
VDIGCGPRNLFKTLGGRPALLIGIDVALVSLKLACEVGYVPLLTDAHDLPLKSGFTDVVAMNGTLPSCHGHAKDVAGGSVAGEQWGTSGGGSRSPVFSKGLSRFWTNPGNPKPIYRWMNRGGHRAEGNEQQWAERTEVHHRPGDGVTEQMFRESLEAAGFDVSIYPHNLAVGREIKAGRQERAANKFRWAQRLSGIDPDSKEAALLLMCVARKRRLYIDRQAVFDS